MAHKTSSSESPMGLQRFEDYYLLGGDLYCIAENKLFRVHRYFFERESTFFKAQLAIPATPGAPRIGTTDDTAVLLDNVRSADFAQLLWVFYNPKYSLYDATVEDCSVDLTLTDLNGSVDCTFSSPASLAEICLNTVIVLYHKFAVDQSYLIPRYVALCERPELPTVEEGIRLRMQTVISLIRARECARNQATSGGRSLSPATLGGTELTEIIKDHFDTMIASVQVFSPRQ
ncbi:hypothetical protein B0H13DRAFT_2210127 [Mycena leptocephala]|nr:hypothetical protein B0H13DRAFT_2210127 [Mycena leptocephala]